MTVPRTASPADIDRETDYVGDEKAMHKRLPLACTIVAAVLLASAAHLEAADARTFGPPPKLYQTTVGRAIEFLSAAQSKEGALSSQAGIGPTALATLGLLRTGHAPGDPRVAKPLAYLEQYVQENGGIYTPGTHIATYETCIALVCFQAANRDGKHDELIKRAETFIRGGQWNESRDKDRSDVYYGGAGYGGKSRPDLSNTAFLVEALKAGGAKADDEAIQRALVFVSRCQNLESEHNTTPFAAKVNDGGFYYTCVGDSQAEERQTAQGGLRSYGSMSYSGLKSMIYAGLTDDDPRVKAAVQWIRKNYDVKSNPGMGDAGLYYYYHTFARTLDVLGADEIEDAKGVKHDWRRELTEELARRQQQNGSWVNSNNRWMEGDPHLATSFALLALSYCQPKPSSNSAP
jgi:squalene-hopene/tetraprenyl-beta-curcumene cyclase